MCCWGIQPVSIQIMEPRHADQLDHCLRHRVGGHLSCMAAAVGCGGGPGDAGLDAFGADRFASPACRANRWAGTMLSRCQLPAGLVGSKWLLAGSGEERSQSGTRGKDQAVGDPTGSK
jgi:hypothetical protein